MSIAEMWAIRDTMRDALDPRIPHTAPVLFNRVVDEWGHIDVRRMWRYLNWLLDRRIALRLAPKYRNQRTFAEDYGGGVGYVRGPGGESPADVAARRRVELLSDGRCHVCRRKFPMHRYGRARCKYCFARHDGERKRAYRDMLFMEGLCARCGLRPRRAELTECQECSNIMSQLRREDRLAAEGAGICVRCFADYARPNRMDCADCAADKARWDAARYARRAA